MIRKDWKSELFYATIEVTTAKWLITQSYDAGLHLEL